MACKNGTCSGLQALQNRAAPLNPMNTPVITNQQVGEKPVSRGRQFARKLGNIFKTIVPFAGGAIGGLLGGPVGAAIGAGAGSAAGALVPGKDALGGTPAGISSYDLFTPEEKEFIKQLGPRGLEMLMKEQDLSPLQEQLSETIGENIGNKFNFEPFRQKSIRQFNEETLPGIFERFTSMGKGAQSTGAFQGMLARGGAELGTGLAALEQEYGLKNRGLDLKQQALLQQLLGQQQNYDLSKRSMGTDLIRMGLTPTQSQVYNQGSPGLSQQVLPYAAQLFDQWLTSRNVASNVK